MTFRETHTRVICVQLESFLRRVADLSASQSAAFTHDIPLLQREIREWTDADPAAESLHAILEYELPLESRRPDVIVLLRSTVVVLELKGKSRPTQADLDQAAGYARDLRCYHRLCADHHVIAVLVPTRAQAHRSIEGAVHVIGPDRLDQFLAEMHHTPEVPPILPQEFVDPGAYRPLPTLVEAARTLFTTGDLPRIHRAHANTQPAVDEISRIIHEAAQTKTRRLVLLTGVPGAGKTLVGLRIVHAHFLDDLAIPRARGGKSVPAVFLSGNGPLVEVLQYELSKAGGGGKAFVRGVKDYVRTYSRVRSSIPPEHVLVFDEAQRAWDADQVRRKHNDGNLASEPAQFIEFAERIPKWCVVVALIGGGQELHQGEEAGIGQWHYAIEHASRRPSWTVHGPQSMTHLFAGVHFQPSATLSLDSEVRFHAASDLHRWVTRLLDADAPQDLRPLVDNLERDGFHLRLTRDLDAAKQYLHERYADAPDKRYGMLRSSRDKALVDWGIRQPSHLMSVGPWYGEEVSDPRGRSCRHLKEPITEFKAQGLELDAALVTWGTDLRLIPTNNDRAKPWGAWSNDLATRYLQPSQIRDPMQLRKNAYRVLLTRGRDGSVIFVPEVPELEMTFQYFVQMRIRVLAT